MSLKELLSIAITIPFFLFLSTLYPKTQILFMALWVGGLGFDVYSTYKFYLKEPSRFWANERNRLFSFLTEKVGFKKAAILFPILIEIPMLLFFAFLPLQTLHTYMFSNPPNNFVVCITASFGISAIGHLQAALKNTHYNRKITRGSHSFTKTTHRLCRYTKTMATTQT
jgi:hypothetical protein